MSESPEKHFRIAAVGDLHMRTTSADSLAAELSLLNGQIDLLVIAGDITDGGRIPEMQAAADALSVVDAPMVGVLGNHDRRGLRRTVMRKTLERAGLELLDGTAGVRQVGEGRTVGFAGVSGTGGGFWFDEPEAVVGGRLRQAVAVKARREAVRLKSALQGLHGAKPDVTIAITHFAPVISTLGEEPVLKHWMLGNSLLGHVIDEDGHVDLALHGHAHLGNRAGETPGGVPVRNVALPVTGGIVIFDVRPGRQVQAVNTVPGPINDRDSETARFRMLDLLRNE